MNQPPYGSPYIYAAIADACYYMEDEQGFLQNEKGLVGYEVLESEKFRGGVIFDAWNWQVANKQS